MPRHKDLLLAAGALLIVLAALALGFHYLGPRERQRAIHADARRVEDLRAIATAILERGAKQPPATLADLPPGLAANLRDPITKAAYEYRPTSATAFEICATFTTASSPDDDAFRPRPTRWDHPQGRHCYQWNAHDGNVP